MYCPQCRSEFQPQFTWCATCEMALVDSLPAEDVFASPESMAESLKDSTLAEVLVGNVAALKNAQRQLADAHIASVIAGEEGAVGPGVHARFYLMVDEGELASAQEHFRRSWHEGVDREGLELSDSDDAAADACPACGHAVPADAAECPECGLFVGALEED